MEKTIVVTQTYEPEEEIFDDDDRVPAVLNEELEGAIRETADGVSRIEAALAKLAPAVTVRFQRGPQAPEVKMTLPLEQPGSRMRIVDDVLDQVDAVAGLTRDMIREWSDFNAPDLKIRLRSRSSQELTLTRGSEIMPLSIGRCGGNDATTLPVRNDDVITVKFFN